MARIRKTFCYADTRAELADYKDARRGAAEDAFWDEDELIDYRRIGKRRDRKPRAGCPENNNGPHIYVWIPYVTWWSNAKCEIKVCCGCEKRPSSRSFRRKSN